MKAPYFLLFPLIILSACAQTAQYPTVKVAGALMEIMHQGAWQARINADTLEADGLYALGAAEGLLGEVMIWNGTPYYSRSYSADSFRVEEKHHPTTLLVYSHVAQWDSVAVPDSIFIQTYLEDFIVAEAHRRGIDTGRAFPFLLKGVPERLSWHIVDGSNIDPQNSDHQSHKSSGAYGLIEAEPVSMLGFFSTHHEGIFTHRRARTHLHVLNSDRSLMGHVDRLLPGNGLTLYLPKSGS